LSFNRGLCLLGLMAMLSMAGCMQRPAFQPDREISARTVRLKVSFIPQTQINDCGPSALAAVLAFHGRDESLDDITRAVFTPVLERTLLPDMENHAKSLGLSTNSGHGDLAMLRSRIDAGTPVILLLEMGGKMYSQGHYVVVFGHDPEGFLMHAGTKADVFLSERELLERWEPMNRLYLVVE
jgi:ABC-type bacteriocin/lantibiotic exporter with double-glycine peptidase domain